MTTPSASTIEATSSGVTPTGYLFDYYNCSLYSALTTHIGSRLLLQIVLGWGDSRPFLSVRASAVQILNATHCKSISHNSERTSKDSLKNTRDRQPKESATSGDASGQDPAYHLTPNFSSITLQKQRYYSSYSLSATASRCSKEIKSSSVY